MRSGTAWCQKLTGRLWYQVLDRLKHSNHNYASRCEMRFWILSWRLLPEVSELASITRPPCSFTLIIELWFRIGWVNWLVSTYQYCVSSGGTTGIRFNQFCAVDGTLNFDP